MSVLVIGAGPVGLILAGELCRHGVPCRIIERRASAAPYCKALGITPRTLEVFEDLGIVQHARGDAMLCRWEPMPRSDRM